METQFIDLSQKMALQKALQNGDNQAIDVVLNEFDRLEAIIKGYEISLKVCTDKMNAKMYKNPDLTYLNSIK